MSPLSRARWLCRIAVYAVSDRSSAWAARRCDRSSPHPAILSLGCQHGVLLVDEGGVAEAKARTTDEGPLLDTHLGGPSTKVGQPSAPGA